MKPYIFSYYVEENRPHVVKSWFGLRQKVVFVKVTVRKSMVFELTDADVKEFFQGRRFAEIIQKIVGGTMYQLETAPGDIVYPDKQLCLHAIRGEWERPSATNLCHPSKGCKR